MAKIAAPTFTTSTPDAEDMEFTIYVQKFVDIITMYSVFPQDVWQ